MYCNCKYGSTNNCIIFKLHYCDITANEWHLNICSNDTALFYNFNVYVMVTKIFEMFTCIVFLIGHVLSVTVKELLDIKYLKMISLFDGRSVVDRCGTKLARI